MNQKTNEFRIATIQAADIPDSADDEYLEALAVREHETVIRTVFGHAEELTIQCPNCNIYDLQKVVIGIN